MYAQLNLVLALAALLYGAAVVLASEWVIAWLRRRRGDRFLTERGRGFRGVRAAVFAVAGLGLVALAYAFFVEPYWPEVTQLSLPSHKIPAGATVRIVHLADLHAEPDAQLEERLPDMIAALEPDVIVFTGDALNHRQGVQVFRRAMARIASIAPTFAVRGNWDVWYWQDVDLYSGTGVQELNGQPARIQLNGAALWIAGAAVDDPSALHTALAAVPPDDFTLFLHHYPERAAAAADARVDLLLAGDTHGGQVRLPFLGPIVKMSRFGGYYDTGLHQLGATHLYVNRGVGMEGGAAPRVRFLCRPEIAVIDLVGMGQRR